MPSADVDHPSYGEGDYCCEICGKNLAEKDD